MLNNKHFRYGHVLWVNEIKFSPRIPKMICDPENQFDAGQHVFITPYKLVADEIRKHTENVVLAEVSDPCSAEVINQYAVCCDWLIVHSMPQPHQMLRIKRKFWRRIVWRTWGHDTVGYKRVEGQWLKNTLRSIVELLWKYEIQHFRAIGIGNVVDKMVIKKKFGHTKFYRLSYSPKDYWDSLNRAAQFDKEETKTLNVLVGHSGDPNDNHFEILKRLEKFKNEDIHLTLILSYPSTEQKYIDSLTAHIHEQWSGKSTVITEMMRPGDYIKLLSQMDIAFFDGLHSNALGNISTLLHFKKKLFLNRKGVLYEAFGKEGVSCCCSDEVEGMTFETFAKPVEYTGSEKKLVTKTYKENAGTWKTLLEDLDAEGGTR